jgi:Kef-type K+ transport system membrane component KefB
VDGPPSRTRWRPTVVYGALIVVALGAYLVIRALGQGLVAPGHPGTTDAASGATERSVSGAGALGHLFLALAVATLAARLVGGAFRRVLKQPAVMGEIVAGLMLGPSVLGALAPDVHAFLLPPEVAAQLGTIAQIGVVLFLFLVGLELDPRLLRERTHAIVAISQASIVVPFLLGAALALWLYPEYASGDVSFTVYSLFLGTALSVTAFPVLARILTDRGVQRTPLGSLALACAAVGDATAWVLLALLAGIARAEVTGAAWTALLVVGYVALVFGVVRPALAGFVRREQAAEGPLAHTTLALVLAAVALSAAATEAIGIHALFGAFLLGAVLPHEGRLPREIRARLEDVVLVLFLPSFFVLTGMRTRIDLLERAGDWLALAAIVLVATLGKFGGSFLAARWTGLPWRSSAALGFLMNARGLMELVVLSVGLDLGVISPTIFTMMVLMALVTTFTATPALDLVLGHRSFASGLGPEVERRAR